MLLSTLMTSVTCGPRCPRATRNSRVSPGCRVLTPIPASAVTWRKASPDPSESWTKPYPLLGLNHRHERMRAAFETVARAAKGHGKAMGVGGVRQDFEFQSWLFRLGVRYLTGGSDVGYILSAGRADVKQLRELKL